MVNAYRALLGLLVLFCLQLMACSHSPSTSGGANAPGSPSTAEVKLDVGQYSVTGPYTHETLSVFIVGTDRAQSQNYLTLDEGLKEGLVVVSEKEQEQVQQLQIENRSDLPLYLQEGDRLKGGKQDRIIFSSIVVPPRSGKLAVPTFCIEQSRWAAGAGGNRFGHTANAGLAPQQVRYAAKVANDQGQVWANVADVKAKSSAGLGAANTNSSLNEAMDSPQVKKLSDDCVAALGGLAESHPGAVGVAMVVNGKVQEVNVYPSHALFKKIYPRLLQSYALDAALTKSATTQPAGSASVGTTSVASAQDVARYMKEGRTKNQRDQDVAPANRLRVRELEGGKMQMDTLYDGAPVHMQWMEKQPDTPGGAAPRQPNMNLNGLQQQMEINRQDNVAPRQQEQQR